MAMMFPERLPQEVLDDPKRSSEKKVYTLLSTLPNKYLVFYSIHWQAVDQYWGMREGEADFVIAHPDKGIVVLEVKGGQIEYDGAKNQWFSIDRFNIKHLIKDPVEQASKSHHELLRQLQNLPNWPDGFVNINHAVCFPDVYLRNQRIKPDLPREIILDDSDLKSIETSIDKLMVYLFASKLSTYSPGSQRIEILKNFLATSFQLKTPLGINLDYEDERLIQLTEQQYMILNMLRNRKRVAISGCAGSGKTMLAVYKAQQFADLGMNVLMVCFNTALAKYLQGQINGLDVTNFHQLCREAARQTGMSLLPKKETSQYFEEYLPEVLTEAAQKIGRVYDAIIIDEGQDFKEIYLYALESLLKPDGYLYFFYDDNQNLYGGGENFAGLITEPAFPLFQNCRNTQSIHKIVAKFHDQPSLVVGFGPMGRDPEIISYDGEQDGFRKLQKLLHILVVEERIHPSDITILTPRGEERTFLKEGIQIGNYRLSRYPSDRTNIIQATTVYQFKGLERKVIILTEIDQRTTYNATMLMYVGCSRARTHLVIMHDNQSPLEIIEKLGNN